MEHAAPLHATIPVLASLDLDESAAFYSGRLGFTVALRTDDYLIATRDGCELHFWLCGERHIAENTSCYARGDVRALHAEFTQRGWCCRRPWSAPGACASSTCTIPTAICSSSANRS